MGDYLTVDVIADRAGVPVLHRKGLSLIKAEDCPVFLRESRELGAFIVGVEGFRLEDAGVVVLWDAMTDFSTVVSPQASIEATERFLAATSAPGVWFEFAIGSDDDAGLT